MISSENAASFGAIAISIACTVLSFIVAVYVPTNHLYLGDVLVLPRDRVSFPDLTVEQGIRIFLTGGITLDGVPLDLASMTNQTYIAAKAAYGGEAQSPMIAKLLEDLLEAHGVGGHDVQ